MPSTFIFISASSFRISGIGYSRISVGWARAYGSENFLGDVHFFPLVLAGLTPTPGQLHTPPSAMLVFLHALKKSPVQDAGARLRRNGPVRASEWPMKKPSWRRRSPARAGCPLDRKLMSCSWTGGRTGSLRDLQLVCRGGRGRLVRPRASTTCCGAGRGSTCDCCYFSRACCLQCCCPCAADARLSEYFSTAS